MLDASPSFHCGGTLGHERSTSNVGKLRFCACAAASQTNTKHTAGIRRDERIANLLGMFGEEIITGSSSPEWERSLAAGERERFYSFVRDGVFPADSFDAHTISSS